MAQRILDFFQPMSTKRLLSLLPTGANSTTLYLLEAIGKASLANRKPLGKPANRTLPKANPIPLCSGNFGRRWTNHIDKIAHLLETIAAPNMEPTNPKIFGLMLHSKWSLLGSMIKVKIAAQWQAQGIRSEVWDGNLPKWFGISWVAKLCGQHTQHEALLQQPIGSCILFAKATVQWRSWKCRLVRTGQSQSMDSLNGQDVCWSWGIHPSFDNVDLNIEIASDWALVENYFGYIKKLWGCRTAS